MFKRSQNITGNGKTTSNRFKFSILVSSEQVARPIEPYFLSTLKYTRYDTGNIGQKSTALIQIDLSNRKVSDT